MYETCTTFPCYSLFAFLFISVQSKKRAGSENVALQKVDALEGCQELAMIMATPSKYHDCLSQNGIFPKEQFSKEGHALPGLCLGGKSTSRVYTFSVVVSKRLATL